MHKYVRALEGGLAFQSYSPQHGLIVYVYFLFALHLRKAMEISN